MKISLANRMKGFQPLIFSELSAYKAQKIAQGCSMIDLSIGSPDLSPPDFIKDALSKAVRDDEAYGYTLTGIKEFNQAVTTYYKQNYQISLNADTEVLLSMGSQDALVHIPMVFSNPGDYVLVPDPGYTAYDAGIAMAESVPYYMPLKTENGFLPDLKAIPEEVAEKTSMMILNFPGNPVPVQATEAFYQQAIAFAKRYNILIIHDFAYGELYFDGKKPISFLQMEGAMDVGVETNSLSKSFNLAGGRIGYLAGNAEIIRQFNRMKSNLDYGVFRPMQEAGILALLEGQAFCSQSREIYQKRRDAFVQTAAQYGWDIPSPEGGMFMWAPVPADMTSMDFAISVMDECHVVITPGHAFGPSGEGYVRIALVQNEGKLTEAAKKIGETFFSKQTLNHI
ncbi:LL-diaminopimelate aminotransferase [Jeotgalibacillus sp. R-1-5s-1]|uniref:LL-diaminopimelate aminotransferase n=1 Tax=Jeotgalibacillus sp. R-1-5s-1 TaxID=2555897 RepID=UPI00106D9A0B|nr:LL-diaminopimelate aminotransferase [Jeotgalibacillus sp. R-1-5s-1]TFE03337.1 LL-diaminopimelate aminotransferase [Jeotgalibacillus sp. R-1-5s-1]